MNKGAVTRDVTNADGAPSGRVRSSGQKPTPDRPADDGDVVLFDTRGRQVSPLRATMTVAEALDDSLGPRR